MKELLYTFVLLLFHQFLFSQNDTVYICGHVNSENALGQAELVKGAYIHLKLSNGGIFESPSNDSGYY